MFSLFLSSDERLLEIIVFAHSSCYLIVFIPS
jgi:hypothetical protein